MDFLHLVSGKAQGVVRVFVDRDKVDYIIIFVWSNWELNISSY